MFTTVKEGTYFSEWLREELEKRSWSQSELARRAELAPSAISMLLSDRNNPRAETCIAIARALDLPAETVLKAADLLPEGAASADDPSISELIDLMKRMTPEQREEILDYALWRFRRDKER